MRALNLILLAGATTIQGQPGNRRPDPTAAPLPPIRVMLDAPAGLACPMPVLRPRAPESMPVTRPDSTVHFGMPIRAGGCFNPLDRGANPLSRGVRISVPIPRDTAQADLLQRLQESISNQLGRGPARRDTTGS